MKPTFKLAFILGLAIAGTMASAQNSESTTSPVAASNAPLALNAEATTITTEQRTGSESLTDMSAPQAATGTTVSFSPEISVPQTVPVQAEEAATTGLPEAAAATSADSDAGTSITTPEGVIYQILKPGTGPVENTTYTLLLHYTLYLPDGKMLESSRDAEFPVPLKLKRNTDSFIKGFEIGTQGMRVGEIRKMYIPAELGYGEKGNEVIPPNTSLVFVTELVDLK